MIEPPASRDAFIDRHSSSIDVAVDLGTATLRVWSTASQLLEVPSALTSGDGPSRSAMQGGVITDLDSATALLETVFGRLRTRQARRPRVLATIPTDASEDERAALLVALHDAGAGLVTLLPEPLAAAVGAGVMASRVPVQMVIDIGEGVTDVAILSRGFILHRGSIRLAGAEIRDCVQRAAFRKGVSLSRQAADAILAANSCAAACCETLDAGFVAAAMEPATQAIATFVRGVFLDLEPRLRSSIADSGVWLTGGGALIPPLRNELGAQLEVPVLVAPDALRSVIGGSWRLLSGEMPHVWDGFED